MDRQINGWASRRASSSKLWRAALEYLAYPVRIFVRYMIISLSLLWSSSRCASWFHRRDLQNGTVFAEIFVSRPVMILTETDRQTEIETNKSIESQTDKQKDATDGFIEKSSHDLS